MGGSVEAKAGPLGVIRMREVKTSAFTSFLPFRYRTKARLYGKLELRAGVKEMEWMHR